MPTFAFLSQLLASVSVIFVSYTLWLYFRSPLKNIPGPFLAKFTDLWRLLNVLEGRAELTHRFLHEKYGQVVRLGPNFVSLGDPALIRVIYNSKGTFLKSAMYNVNDAKVGKDIIHNMFNTRSNEVHDKMLRPVKTVWGMDIMTELEPRINDTIDGLLERLDELFVDGPNAGTTCDMEDWLVYFAWDSIAQLSFGKSMDFMKEGRDHSGFLFEADQTLDYFSVIMQMPWLDKWLAKNLVKPIGMKWQGNVVQFCVERVMERKATGPKQPGQIEDMLDYLFDAQKSNQDLVTDKSIIDAMILNILAGAHTTAIALEAIVYFVLKNPRVHRKLQEEIDASGLKFPFNYQSTTKLPYLDAVIRESRRVHCPVGLCMERIVPESGLTLANGAILPPGTIVGMSPWVVHQNKEVYGEDASAFKPERWLRYEDGPEREYESRVSAMRQTDLSFGSGNRVCVGKNVAMVETFKLVATLFATYDMSLVDPKKEWKVKNSWFVRQTGIRVKMQKRMSAAKV